MVAGLLLFAIGAVRRRTGALRTLKQAVWMAPWFGGHVIIGWIGRYGGGKSMLPNWVDVGVVIVFALVIFYWAVASSLTRELAAREVAKDAHQIDMV